MQTATNEIIEQPIECPDGQVLACTVHEPKRAAATLVVFPGVAVRRSTYRGLASWLAARGVRVATFDYRGVGDSPLAPARRRATTLSTWGADALAVFRAVEARYGAPAVLGHSFGGQVLGLADDFRRAPAILLIAAQFGAWRNWTGADRFKLAAYWHLVAPAASWLAPSMPGWLGLGVSLPSGVAREWSRWGRRRDYLLDVIAGARSRYAAIAAPVRAYTFTDDSMAPRRATDHLLSAMRSAAIERRVVAPADIGAGRIGHFGFFRDPAARLWEETLDFLFEHAARPPGHTSVDAERQRRAVQSR